MIEEIKNELNKVEVRLDEAVKNLKTFEEGENNGKWLEGLRGKARRKEELDEEEKKQLARLEGKEKLLEELKKSWEEQVTN